MERKYAKYAAEEIDALLRDGSLNRLGMGSRRACYALPDGQLCVKCYRSDEEIAEGKYPWRNPPGHLSSSVVREIRNCRFDEKRNSCCQEYRYWNELQKSISGELMGVFPAIMEKMLLPSRGWCVVEELVMNADGTPPTAFFREFRLSAPSSRPSLIASLDRLFGAIMHSAVRIYDPQNLLLQKNADGAFRIRITDFEPASRTLIAFDRFPFIVRMKLRRRFARYRRMFGIYGQATKK